MLFVSSWVQKSSSNIAIYGSRVPISSNRMIEYAWPAKVFWNYKVHILKFTILLKTCCCFIQSSGLIEAYCHTWQQGSNKFQPDAWICLASQGILKLLGIPIYQIIIIKNVCYLFHWKRSLPFHLGFRPHQRTLPYMAAGFR